MARTNPATAGDNVTPLTDDERSALVTHYELKIIADCRKVAALEVDLRSARSVVNGHYKRVTADLGFTRKEFEAEVVVLGQMTDAEYARREARRSDLHRLSGRKSGEQQDLVDLIADTVDEAIATESAGYRAGRRADDPVPPKEIAAVLIQDWMRGYHAGQEFNGLQLAKAAEVLARPKPGEMVAGEDPDEALIDAGDVAEVLGDLVESGAKSLKDSGWAGPTAEEAVFEEADGGKTVRKPRPSRAKAPAQAEAA